MSHWKRPLHPIPLLLAACLTACQAGGEATLTSEAAAPAAAMAAVELPPPETYLSAAAGDGEVDREALASALAELPPSDPRWPVYAYLSAEAAARVPGGDPAAARAAFAAIARWAAADPYGERWGGSALSVVALWRWLELLPESDDADGEAVEALETAAGLLETRFARGLFDSEVLSSMPQVEADLMRRLALLAWTGGRTDDARRYFVRYVARSAGELGERELAIGDELVRTGQLTEQGIRLARARRLAQLAQLDTARDLARSVLDGPNGNARAEAGLLLADLEIRLDARKRGADRGVVVALLERAEAAATSPTLAEEALYQQAKLLNSSGTGRDLEGRRERLERLRASYPTGSRTDDALVDLARQEQEEGRIDDALALFERLRAFEGDNDYLHTASFVPAMILRSRGRNGDLERAAELLVELREREPYGPYRTIATFWAARVRAELGDEAGARALFEELMATAPYEYHGVRARMHLAEGARAAQRLVPDGAVCATLAAEFASSPPPGGIGGRSPYHLRLRHALDSGLYRRALDAEIALRTERAAPERLESLPVEELGALPTFPALAALLALRQDVLAARDAIGPDESLERNRLELAAAVMGPDQGLDTPLAMRLVYATGEPRYARWAAQREPGYLQVAYPAAFRDPILAAAQGRSLPPELVYAIVRRESLFFPAALSPSSALGLFQMLRPTVESLGVVPEGRDWRQFLLDPRNSLEAGALLASRELAWQRTKVADLARELGRPEAPGERLLLYVIMAQNAGGPTVRTWWRTAYREGREDDLEQMIATITAGQTRNFSRGVVSDLGLARAGGLFGEACAQPIR